MCRSADVLVRRLEARDLETLNRELPVWNAGEYARRLEAQSRGGLEQAIAWIDDAPVGRGMALFPGHEEYSISAVREGCAEGRDVFVRPERRRMGVARSIMTSLEAAAGERGFPIGLSVSTSEDAEPARALYASLGYRPAHGPYVTSTFLDGDEGPIPVFAVLTYLVKPR